MYFITKKDSETGRKFQKIVDKFDICFENQKALANKYGFTSWRGAYWVIDGGISSVIFPKDTIVDTKVWKKVKDKENEYTPRLNTKQGKAVQADFDQAPTISRSELNACVGWDEEFSNIGFDKGNDKYFGFCVSEDCDVVIPKDCKEITTTTYRELFGK